MKKSFLYILLVAFLGLNTGCHAQSAREIKRNAYLVNLVNKALQQGHYNPLELNDDFSEKAYSNYLKQNDPFKRFFTQEDLDTLSFYQNRFDDELQATSFGLFNLAVELLNKRQEQTEDFYIEILDEPFDYEKKEYLEFDPDKREWVKNDEELRDLWRRMLKYETLNRLSSKMEEQEEALAKQDTAWEEKSFDEMEADARESVRKRYKDYFKYLSQMENEDHISDYINAFVSVYDPHTAYFPPKRKEDFDINFSGQLEGIGATLTSRDGYVTVNNIVPGSPSWKQGELEVNDKILKVGQGDEEEAVDIVDMRLDKAVQLIRGKKGTKVRLTVKKVDGSTKEIPIVRDVVVIEETYAKSTVIEDEETGERIGYIYLPSFYNNFNDTGIRRTAAGDMRKEIEKLKKENVSGIVLDLRNDGGGSLQDAVEIAGMFIEDGPVVQVKSTTGDVRVLRDYNKNINWDKPMVIMVNHGSASASEILAAAMQDYKRAVIMGSKSTFGKGTVQRFFDLDGFVRGQDDIKPLGAIKVTVQKFYRINGGATQLEGVTPDIIVPDLYTYMDIGEKDLDYPLPWTEIKKSSYDMLADNEAAFEKSVAHSMDRIKEDSVLMLVDENAKRLKEQRDKTKYPLALDEFELRQDSLDKLSEKYKDVGKDSLDIKIFTLTDDLAEIEADSTKQESTERWHKRLMTDNYLYEAIKVIQDLNGNSGNAGK
jgi:carboxyl-terminal processing protease